MLQILFGCYKPGTPKKALFWLEKALFGGVELGPSTIEVIGALGMEKNRGESEYSRYSGKICIYHEMKSLCSRYAT